MFSPRTLCFTPVVALAFIHKQQHPSFLMKGKVSFINDEGMITTVEAPHTQFTQVGTQRVFYIHEDTVWVCVYKTNAKTVEEAEKVIFNANNEVVKIGKVITNKEDVYGEFIGMMKLSPRGSEIFKLHFIRAKQIFWGKPYQRAETFEKAYITDLIQDMVDMGVSIHCVIIERGWKEIDTVEDYQKALLEFESD